MKNIPLILILIIVSFVSIAQDTIRKTNGEVIIGIIKEINEQEIIYTHPSQEQGPIRKISIRNVYQVTYSDGLVEHFSITSGQSTTETGSNESKQVFGTPGTINNTDQTVTVYRRGPDIRVKPGERFPTEDDRQKNAFYFEVLAGLSLRSVKIGSNSSYESINYSTYTSPAIGIRGGFKHYFGSNEKCKIGINVVFAHIMALPGTAEFDLVLSPLNLGFASFFKTGKNTTIELNATGGGALWASYPTWSGFKYGADIKLRRNHVIFGIDYSRIDTAIDFRSPNANLISLTFGFHLY